MTGRDKTGSPEPEEVYETEEVDDALDASFPASDPPAFVTPHRNEPPPQGDGSRPADARPAADRQGGKKERPA